MANDLKGEAPLNALGRDWTLKLPFSAAQALKTDHGIDLINAPEAMADVAKFDAVLLAMLKPAQPDATPETAMAILDEVGMKPVADAMVPALAAFAGVPVEEMRKAVDSPPPAAPGVQ